TLAPPVETPPEQITLDPVCEPPEARNPVLPPANPAPSTRRMAELLARFSENPQGGALNFMSDRLASMLESKLTTDVPSNERFRLQFGLGVEQTRAGRPDLALNTFAAVERFVAEQSGTLDESSRVLLRNNKAMAFLRLGEQENCLATHNADS